MVKSNKIKLSYSNNNNNNDNNNNNNNNSNSNNFTDQVTLKDNKNCNYQIFQKNSPFREKAQVFLENRGFFWL